MAWLLNLILPGTGLIILRREWLGLTMAIVFAICGNVAMAGTWIAPEAIPADLVRLSLALAVVFWMLSQYLFHRQGRILSRTAHGVENVLAEARAAMDAGQLALARRALDSGLALDDEHLELRVLRARLFGLEGDEQAMHREWRRVLRLDRRRVYSGEAQTTLQASTGGDPPQERVPS